tara:strand:+ start:307 stop:1206 length:900 start_codon:yes stop_codon:yes gene_type:complete
MVGLPPFNTPMLDGQSTNNRCGPTTLEVTGIDYTVDTSNLDSIGGAQETQPLGLDFFSAPIGYIDPSFSPEQYEAVLNTLSEGLDLGKEVSRAYTDAIEEASNSIQEGWGEFTDAVRDGEWKDAAGAGSDIISSAKGVGANISDTLTKVITNTDAFKFISETYSEVGIASLKAIAASLGSDMAQKVSGGVYYDGSISIRIDVKFTKTFFEEQLYKLEYLNQQVCVEARAQGTMGMTVEIDHSKLLDPEFNAKLSAGIYATLSGNTLDSMGMQIVAGVGIEMDVWTGEVGKFAGVWVENN